ncbi:hypothetical protein Bbelb_406010 [Branchiostoma belcheri]|nr:hypothetical protein Bbelb_406010 [Branchiostoma belcheri]
MAGQREIINLSHVGQKIDVGSSDQGKLGTWGAEISIMGIDHCHLCDPIGVSLNVCAHLPITTETPQHIAVISCGCNKAFQSMAGRSSPCQTCDSDGAGCLIFTCGALFKSGDLSTCLSVDLPTCSSGADPPSPTLTLMECCTFS